MSVVIQLTVEEMAALRYVGESITSWPPDAGAYPMWVAESIRRIARRLPTEPRCLHQLHLNTGTVRCELLADEPHQHRATTGQGVRVAWDEPQREGARSALLGPEAAPGGL